MKIHGANFVGSPDADFVSRKGARLETEFHPSVCLCQLVTGDLRRYIASLSPY